MGSGDVYKRQAAHITYNRRAGGCGRMLKVLLNGYCSYDCAYCSVRLKRERLGFSPDEFAEAFLRLWHEDLVGGLFPVSYTHLTLPTIYSV